MATCSSAIAIPEKIKGLVNNLTTFVDGVLTERAKNNKTNTFEYHLVPTVIGKCSNINLEV